MIPWSTLLAAAIAPLQVGMPSQPADPRIQLVTYSATQVYTLPVPPGYAAVVELGPDERVDSVVVGDSSGWQVTASKRGDHVVVKPTAGAAATDMIVITGERRYVFLLQPGSGESASPFVMRFVYPETTPIELAAAPPTVTYRFRGAKQLYPQAMGDDGKRTTIHWGTDVALPAIFAVQKDGREAIVNGRMVEGDFVIEGTAPRYVFRLGKAEATATRRTAAERR